MDKIRGFTLIEMLTVVAILALLAAVAIPNFRAMIASSQQTTAANQIIGSINMARNEAITRSTNITVTAANNSGGDPDWAAGWRIEYDDDNDVTTAPFVLATVEPLPRRLTVTQSEDEAVAPPPATSLQFNRQGRLAFVDGAAVDGVAMPQTFTICDERTEEVGRQIAIERVGRASVSTVTCK